MYGIKTADGYWYAGIGIFGQTLVSNHEPKQFPDKLEAEQIASELGGARVILLARWMWDWAVYFRHHGSGARV